MARLGQWSFNEDLARIWEDLVSVYQKDSALLIELLCLGGSNKAR